MPLGCAVLLTQPALLTGTATICFVITDTSLNLRRNPHPSRGRQQLCLGHDHQSLVDATRTPHGDRKTEKLPTGIPVGSFFVSLSAPAPCRLCFLRRRRRPLRPARAELTARGPAHRLQPDVTAGAVVRIIPEGKAGSSAALWAHIRRPLKDFIVGHKRPS